MYSNEQQEKEGLVSNLLILIGIFAILYIYQPIGDEYGLSWLEAFVKTFPVTVFLVSVALLQYMFRPFSWGGLSIVSDVAGAWVVLICYFYNSDIQFIRELSAFFSQPDRLDVYGAAILACLGWFLIKETAIVKTMETLKSIYDSLKMVIGWMKRAFSEA